MIENPLKYKIHYRTLQLDLGSDWLECKNAYKKLVKIWHPDRLTNNQDNGIQVNERIKSINIAYSCISKYYKKHNSMPGKLLIDEDIENYIDQNKKSFDLSSLYSHINTNTNKKSRLKTNNLFPIVILIIISIILIYIINLYSETENTKIQIIKKIKPSSVEVIVLKQKVKLYFTLGSTIGEVLDSQGTPTRTEGTKWFYNNSWVEFKNSRVSGWYDVNDNSLHVENQTINNIKKLSLNHSVNKFSKNSTKSNVLITQGEPIRKTKNIWYYQDSKIFFKNDKVDSWYNSPLDPLQVNE